ncbi:hypothetical protein HMPREF0454_00403, partial [Hafnia alvei ATCC 51873]
MRARCAGALNSRAFIRDAISATVWNVSILWDSGNYGIAVKYFVRQSA